MKFLCEQCKAKYQISDDKVAGKTVRMKCRKCGHMIEVRAEVTETSVAQGLPEEKKPAAPKPAAARGGLATSLTARPPPPKGKPDALAGAFTKGVTSDRPPESTAALEMLDAAATSGWYVAINGVPVGPIRVSELRRKAANGAITEDSLAWREGLEEWRPVRSITEIAEIVREALTSGRPSLVTPPPTDARSSSLPPPAAAPRESVPPPRAPQRPQPHAPRAEPQRPAPIAARNNVVPFTGRLATAEKREEAEDIDVDEDVAPASASSSTSGVPVKPTAPTPAPIPAPQPERNSQIIADPFALPPPPVMTPPPVAAGMTPAPVAASASPFAAPQPSLVAIPPAQIAPQQGPPKWLLVGLLLGFIGFGITAAVFMFRPQQQQQPQTIVITQPQAMNTANTPAGPSPTQQPQDLGDLDDGKTPGKPRTGGGVAKAPTPGKGDAVKLDPSLVGGLPGPGVSPNGPGPATPRSELSGDQIESTVRNYNAGVKRTCWERLGVQTSSVNVTAKVTIVSTGQVQSVSAEGNDPAVAKCIENQIHGWKFPASNGTTTVNIPFKFVRQ